MMHCVLEECINNIFVKYYCYYYYFIIIYF